MVWLKIRRHDIIRSIMNYVYKVVVWLKIRRHDIKSNNIVWLDIENDGVEQTGWYDLDASIYGFFEEGTEKEGAPNYKYGMMDLICSEDAINEGFDSWSEDVYTWELREPIEEDEE